MSSGGKAEPVRVDIADPDSAAAMAGATVERFGGIDYLVNNAAIFGGMQLDFVSPWTGSTSTVPLGKHARRPQLRAACYPAMKARGGGAIVNQSSTAAYLYAGFYGLAKAGVNSITQQLAHELGGQTSGPTPSPRAPSTPRHPHGSPRRLHRSRFWLAGHQASGQPSDLVGMCLFLLSDEASWITGHVFNVDGGQVVRP